MLNNSLGDGRLVKGGALERLNDLDSKSIVYVSKYASIPPAQAGLRGLLLLEHFMMRGHSVRLVTSDSNHLNERAMRTAPSENSVPVTIIRAPQYRRGESLRRLLSWIVFDLKVSLLKFPASFRPDVVVASSPSLLTLLSGFLLARRYRAAFVAEVRDIWPLTALAEFSFPRNHPAVKVASLIEKFSYRVSDAVVGTMPNLSEHLTGLGIRDKTVVAIGLGIDRKIPATVAPPARKRVQGELVVGYAGSIGKSNALHLLLELANDLESNPNVFFRIAGDGDLKVELKLRYGTLSNVEFLGRVAKDEIPTFLNDCDVLYFATPTSAIGKYGQSLNKIIDYMLAGRPILGSYSGFPSMVDEADCGWFVPSEDRDQLKSLILELAEKSESELQEIGKRGFDWVTAHRRYDVLGDTYLELISRVCKDVSFSRSQKLFRDARARDLPAGRKGS